MSDKKVGQLVALRRREWPRSKRDVALTFITSNKADAWAVDNLDVDSSVWRWILGFHAALYREPLSPRGYSLVTPFPRGDLRDGVYVIRPIKQQHLLAVEAIKRNRAQNNLDRLCANRGKLVFECIWDRASDDNTWICFFCVNVYDWKDLGSQSPNIPARGCAGIYVLADGSCPEPASRAKATTIAIPNADPFDPFGG